MRRTDRHGGTLLGVDAKAVADWLSFDAEPAIWRSSLNRRPRAIAQASDVG